MDRIIGFVRSFGPELILLLALGLAFTLNIGAFDIDPYSELFHLQSAKESLASGRFFTPILNGHDYLVRAPFWSWLLTCVFKIGGVTLMAARIPAIICALLGLVFTYLLTLELTKSRFSAFFSAAVLGSTWGYFSQASLSTADIFTTVLYVAFTWAFLQWISFANRRSVIPLEMNIFSLAFGVILGLLILTKGLWGALILLLINGLYLVMAHGIPLLKRLNPLLVLAPIFLLPLPWFAWVAFQTGNPMFVMDYLFINPAEKFLGLGLWETLQRDWGFYLKRLPMDLLPYILFLPVALIDNNLRGRNMQAGWQNWLGFWFLTGLLVYSASAFQEPTLLLPFYPPLAILIGSYLAQVMESVTEMKAPGYNGVLIAYIAGLMIFAVIGSVLIFQIIPSDYVEGFWRWPGQATIEFLEITEHRFDLPEAFPLWKFWLIPGPFILLIGGFALFLLQAERRITATPMAIVITMISFLLFIKAVYMPIMHRPVMQVFAKQLNQTAQPGDRILLYSTHPDIKRVLFYLKPELLAQTRIVRKPAAIQQGLDNESAPLFGIIRERSFFDELAIGSRDKVQVNQYAWKWDTTQLNELQKLLVVRQPHFNSMKSGLIFFRSLPPVTQEIAREEEAMEAILRGEAQLSRKKRKRR